MNKTEYIISRIDGPSSQILGTVNAYSFDLAILIARQKWWFKPKQLVSATIGTRAEIRFARDMEADGIISDLEFEENMTQWLGAKEGAR